MNKTMNTAAKKQEALDHTVMAFGKYKDKKTPEQVAEENPSYLVWAYETVKNRPVCSEVLYRECKKTASKSIADREYDDEEEHRANAAYGYLGQN
jgi:hypothetical protein